MENETTNDNEESITDIVNSLVSEEQEPEGIEVDVAKAKLQESQNRSQAMQNIRKDQTTAQTMEAKKAVGSYKQQLEAQAREIVELKKMFGEQGKKYQGLEKDIQVHSDRMLTDDVINMENELAKNPKYMNRFNRDAVRKLYVDAAQKEKRYFTPAEAHKLNDYDNLLEAYNRYEKQNELRKSFMEGGMTSNANTPESDGLSDVKTLEDAQAYSRKKAQELFGS